MATGNIRDMTVRIPDTVFLGFNQWMALTPPWAARFQIILNTHMGQWCDSHDIDTFEQLARQIGPRQVSTLKDYAFMDFLSRETGGGNAVDHYLNAQGGRETKIVRDYLAGCRASIVSLYEISDIRPGKSFLARDLIVEANPFRVQEDTATRTLQGGERAAMRIIRMPKASILAGHILCLPPVRIAELINQILEVADSRNATRAGNRERVSPGAQHDLSVRAALKFCAPLFSDAWLNDTVAPTLTAG